MTKHFQATLLFYIVFVKNIKAGLDKVFSKIELGSERSLVYANPALPWAYLLECLHTVLFHILIIYIHF